MPRGLAPRRAFGRGGHNKAGKSKPSKPRPPSCPSIYGVVVTADGTISVRTISGRWVSLAALCATHDKRSIRFALQSWKSDATEASLEMALHAWPLSELSTVNAVMVSPEDHDHLMAAPDPIGTTADEVSDDTIRPAVADYSIRHARVSEPALSALHHRAMQVVKSVASNEIKE